MRLFPKAHAKYMQVKKSKSDFAEFIAVREFDSHFSYLKQNRK
jgi:hypothetical protein